MNIRLIPILFVVLTIASCTSATLPPPPTATPAPPTPTATPASPITYEDMRVGFIQSGTAGKWFVVNTTSFETQPEIIPGIQLKVYDAQGEKGNQIEAFHQFNLDPKLNVIVLDALDPTGWDDVLREARAAGKIVILENRRIDAPADLYASYIASDFVEEGRQAAVEMCKLLEGSAKKNVVELVANVDTSTAADRDQGFRAKMGDCGIKLTQALTDNREATPGEVVMGAFLKTNKDIQGVLAQDYEVGLGAIQAIKDAGLKPGLDIKIVVISADPTRTFGAMSAGDLNATIESNALLGPDVYETALYALNGEPFPKWMPANTAAVDDPEWAKRYIKCNGNLRTCCSYGARCY